MSSFPTGCEKVGFRLWRRGHRRLNHAAYTTVVTKLRYSDSESRAYFGSAIDMLLGVF